MRNVIILGGDERFYYFAKVLASNKCSVTTYGVCRGEELSEEAVKVCTEYENCNISGADYLVLPIPVTTDGKTISTNNGVEKIKIMKLAQDLRQGQTVLGGIIPPELRAACEEKKVRIIDFMKLGTIAEKNAVATAEGAMAEAIIASPINIQGSEILVIGFGKCGRVMAEKLKKVGGDVTVMARREEVRKEAEMLGLKSSPMFGQCGNECGKFDFVFNTVPAMVLPESVISQMSSDTLIIDIASKPGGTDFEACKKYGIDARLCLGLPGKYSPKTSAKILADVVLSEA